jgi:hypothetical protein
MNSRLSAIGCFSTIAIAACASGGAVSISESRGEASLGNASSENLIPRRSCSSANTSVVAADGVLADFSSKKGKIVTSVLPGSPPTTLTQSTDAGNLIVNVNAVPGARPQFLTTTMLFDGCVDASGYSGVQFSLAGTLSGCSLVYASVDPEHQYYGPEGPYPSQTPIPVSDLTSQPRTITASFRNPGIQGRPATPTDPSKLAFIQWMVIVPVGSTDGTPVPPCTGSMVIDDVKLYR